MSKFVPVSRFCLVKIPLKTGPLISVWVRLLCFSLVVGLSRGVVDMQVLYITGGMWTLELPPVCRTYNSHVHPC